MCIILNLVKIGVYFVLIIIIEMNLNVDLVQLKYELNNDVVQNFLVKLLFN